MTLVYPAADPGYPDSGGLPPTPVTHAFVIGCGRFPYLSSNRGMDRAATAAGARQMLQFLTQFGPRFLAPIATIECLISDPAVQPGQDKVDIVQAPGAAPVSVAVDAVLKGNAEAAGEAWINRCRQGDHMFFYMSSHGITDGAAALGLFEDVLSNKNRKWSQSLNITTLSQGLMVNGADRAWVFLDACQEVIQDVIGAPTGSPSLDLIQWSVSDLVRLKRKPVTLAGSRLGGRAWAPTDGRPPYFTQALLAGLSNAFVEPLPGLGWVVTGQQILFGINDVADAVLDWSGLQADPLHIFNERGLGLLRIEAPQVPIKISTFTEAHMANCTNGEAVSDDGGAPTVVWQAPANGTLVWRFMVDADQRRQFTATLAFPTNVPAYQPQTFSAMPPAQILVLKP